jgi:hypothetical protein
MHRVTCNGSSVLPHSQCSPSQRVYACQHRASGSMGSPLSSWEPTAASVGMAIEKATRTRFPCDVWHTTPTSGPLNGLTTRSRARGKNRQKEKSKQRLKRQFSFPIDLLGSKGFHTRDRTNDIYAEMYVYIYVYIYVCAQDSLFHAFCARFFPWVAARVVTSRPVFKRYQLYGFKHGRVADRIGTVKKNN